MNREAQHFSAKITVGRMSAMDTMAAVESRELDGAFVPSYNSPCAGDPRVALVEREQKDDGPR
jgi:hypothetical protein